MAKLAIARLLYGLKGLFDDPVGLFRELDVQSHDQILEIGCAIGYHTLALATIASEGSVCAVDIWEEALAHLAQKTATFQNVEIICTGAEVLPFPAASFDRIVCFDTLHELRQPGRAVVAWASFLRRNGKLLYRDPSIPADTVETFAAGQLTCSEIVRGVAVFVRATPKGARVTEPG